ncbi:MAG: PadR family transcriptional regulator [Candidatus Thorarchaeota archaeon]|jgi:DNA-binding PadR family transcriptional regulator
MSKSDDTYSKQVSELQEILSDFSQFYIVILLSEGPIHGYGMIRSFKQRTGKTLSAGTLYPFLQNLESKGFVQKKDEATGKRPKIVYSLTRKGKSFCERLFKRFAAITVSALEPSLETCASCGAKVYEGAHHEKVDGVDLAFCCKHCAKAFLSGH